jgi:hypothetical protein
VHSDARQHLVFVIAGVTCALRCKAAPLVCYCWCYMCTQMQGSTSCLLLLVLHVHFLGVFEREAEGDHIHRWLQFADTAEFLIMLGYVTVRSGSSPP